MSIERAEQLKKELTDKWVVVASDVAELRRFEDLTGRVKTVNMNCRALVEFDGPVDIGWYDIDPGFLTVVDGPSPKKKAEEPKAEKAAPAAKPAAAAAGGGSALDQIRAQSGGAAKPATGGSALDQIRAQSGGAAKPAAGGSALDQIRAQSAAPAAEETTAAAEPEAETPPPAAPAADKADTSGMSPLDAIRAQGGFKG